MRAESARYPTLVTIVSLNYFLSNRSIVDSFFSSELNAIDSRCSTSQTILFDNNGEKLVQLQLLQLPAIVYEGHPSYVIRLIRLPMNTKKLKSQRIFRHKTTSETTIK